MSKWQWSQIGLVSQPIERPEMPVAGTDYRQVGVRLWGEGAYERESIDGAGTNYSTLNRVEEGDIIVNKIWARNGSVSVVSEALAGCYCSGEFPLFAPDRNLLEPKWFYWITKTRWFWQACDLQSRGTSGKNRIKPEKFLQIEIPLPPLEEQQRIVAKIDRLAAKIDEARGLRIQTASQIEALIESVELNIWPAELLASAVPLEMLTTFLGRGRHSAQGDSDVFLVKTQHVQQDHYVPTTLRLDHASAARTDEDSLLQDGDIMIACSAAGCLGRVARYREDGKSATTDSHVAIARPLSDLVDPEYLYAYLRGAQGQIQLRSRERGDWKREKVGFRLTELNLRDLKQVPVPLPNKTQQHKIVAEIRAVQNRMADLRVLQAQTAAELDALLPSILNRAFKGEL